VPSLPCTMSGLLGDDAATVSCTTDSPATIAAGVNVTMPLVLQTTARNYAVAPRSGTLVALFAMHDCFASPLANTLESVSTSQQNGAGIDVRCNLLDASGATVLTARGNLTVQDLGVHAASTAVTILTRSNAFAAGHYYRVIAEWSDGSSSTGYFRIQ